MASSGIISARAAMAFSTAFSSISLNISMAIFPTNLTSCHAAFSVKAELEQGSDKPLSYAVLGVCVDVPVFKGGKADSFAVMP